MWPPIHAKHVQLPIIAVCEHVSSKVDLRDSLRRFKEILICHYQLTCYQENQNKVKAAGVARANMLTVRCPLSAFVWDKFAILVPMAWA